MIRVVRLFSELFAVFHPGRAARGEARPSKAKAGADDQA